VILHATQNLTNRKKINERFEMIEREKDILEEEYGNSIALNEDLCVQFE
jgi:hypothetical protein